MVRKVVLVVVSAFLLSGCSLNLPFSTGTSGGSIWKSFDGGATFTPKITVNEKQRISSADIVSVVFDPRNAQVIYIGTKEDGIFKTSDGAEHWEQLLFPPLNTYGLAIDHDNGDRLYASGVYNDISKIYRTDDAGKNWKEVYTEPGSGTVITALASHPEHPQVLYAGTSAGVVIKTVNGGEKWENIATLAKGPVGGVLFETGAPDTVMLFVFEKGMIVSHDGGKQWDDYTEGGGAISRGSRGQRSDTGETLAPAKDSSPQKMTAAVADPLSPGVVYAGAKNGLFRSRDGGKTWEPINIIESSKKFPIRAIAVNPRASQEIAYAAGAAFYKSSDGGMHWATTQMEIDRGVSFIKYDPSDPAVIYFTLRKF